MAVNYQQGNYQLIGVDFNTPTFTMVGGMSIDDIKIKYNWFLNAQVEGAIIGEDSNGLVWYQGDWICGTWEDGTWYSGIFHGGRWKKGNWFSYDIDQDEMLKGKLYVNRLDISKSQFLSGTWEGGTFNYGIFGQFQLTSETEIPTSISLHFITNNIKDYYISGITNYNSGETYYYMSGYTDVVPNQMLNLNQWIVGTSGSQGDFINIGPTSDNTIVNYQNPWEINSPTWKTISDGISGPNGGWNLINYPIDNAKTYRFSVWIRREYIGNGRTYFGVQHSTVCNLGTNIINNNPYFGYPSSGQTPNISNNWLLFVGHVHPAGYTGVTDSESGIYDLEGNKQSYSFTDYQWSSGTTVSGHRSYLYYSSTVGEVQYWSSPRMEVINEFSPTLEDLLNNVPYEKTYYKSDTIQSPIFMTGDFLDGWMNAAKIENGNFMNGFINNSSWYNGKFYNGIFLGDIWYYGEFLGGDFSNGIWKNGNLTSYQDNVIARFGTFYKISGVTEICSGATWENGIFKNGEFHSKLNEIDGVTLPSSNNNKVYWFNGTWENGTWYGGTFSNGTWLTGTFFSGIILNIDWKKGHFENGYWKNGTMEEGTISGGIFENITAIKANLGYDI
jgi:hypothetical protein